MSLPSVLPYKYLNLLSYLLLCEVIEGDNDKNNNMKKMIILTVKTTMSNVMKLPPVQWYKQRYQDPWDKYTNWYRDPWAKFVSNGVMLFFGREEAILLEKRGLARRKNPLRYHWGTKIPENVLFVLQSQLVHPGTVCIIIVFMYRLICGRSVACIETTFTHTGAYKNQTLHPFFIVFFRVKVFCAQVVRFYTHFIVQMR